MRHHHHPCHARGGMHPFHAPHWDGGRGMRHGHGPMEGRGPRRRIFDAGELRLVLLKLIAERPRHGYDLIVALEEMTRSAYTPSPGVIYPTLTLLQDMGLIEETTSEGPRKIFAATEEGRAHLSEAQAQVDGILSRLEALAEEQGRSGAMPIRRAMENLKSALRNRMSDPEMKPETIDFIVELLDETARGIERLKG